MFRKGRACVSIPLLHPVTGLSVEMCCVAALKHNSCCVFVSLHAAHVIKVRVDIHHQTLSLYNSSLEITELQVP